MKKELSTNERLANSILADNRRRNKKGLIIGIVTLAIFGGGLFLIHTFIPELQENAIVAAQFIMPLLTVLFGLRWYLDWNSDRIMKKAVMAAFEKVDEMKINEK